MKPHYWRMAAALVLLNTIFSGCSNEGLTAELREPAAAPANAEVEILPPAPADVAQPEGEEIGGYDGLETRALAAGIALEDWMAALPDSTSIAGLSIPGTHDSAALVEPISGIAKCQNLSLADQLRIGVRFLDIRCRHIGNGFAIHHGQIYQRMNFDEVLQVAKSFLAHHPGEVVVMSVKEEYDPTDNTRTFEQTFDTFLASYEGLWATGNTIPSLGQVRGKIVLLRRFPASSTPKGIYASGWHDNATFDVSVPGGKLRIQDQYVVPDNNGKWANITNLFNEATSPSPTTLYLNFTSGYKDLLFGIPSITTVSNGINPRISDYFSNNTRGRFGVVIMDFVDLGKSSLIVDTNF